jgi:hypothetical protein
MSPENFRSDLHNKEKKPVTVQVSKATTRTLTLPIEEGFTWQAVAFAIILYNSLSLC